MGRRLHLQESVYDDADSLFGPPSNGNVHSPSRIAPASESSLKGILKKSPSDTNTNKGEKLSNDTNIEIEKTCDTDILTDCSKVNYLFKKTKKETLIFIWFRRQTEFSLRKFF